MISSHVPLNQKSKYSGMLMNHSKSNFSAGNQQPHLKRSGPITSAIGSGLFKRFRNDTTSTKMASTVTTSAYLNDFAQSQKGLFNELSVATATKAR